MMAAICVVTWVHESTYRTRLVKGWAIGHDVNPSCWKRGKIWTADAATKETLHSYHIFSLLYWYRLNIFDCTDVTLSFISLLQRIHSIYMQLSHSQQEYCADKFVCSHHGQKNTQYLMQNYIWNIWPVCTLNTKTLKLHHIFSGAVLGRLLTACYHIITVLCFGVPNTLL